ncbi:MAG: hypothetical protein HQL69_21820 [Magnetococcales bacterium]|nr:hypothetical protein [Magnetococcales bacterium]
MMGQLESGMGYGHGLFGGLWMVLVWIIPILLVVWLISGSSRFNGGFNRNEINKRDEE